MTLDIKRKPGRPKKIVVEPDANKIIDIWLKEEPDTDRDVFLKGCKAAALIGLTFFLFACGIYVTVRA
jgi:hypothetical protein